MTHHAAPCILLGEPDDTTRLFLTDKLAADGYEVQAVTDRDAALDQLVDGDPDLILVDVTATPSLGLGTARSIPGPRPCLFDVGFPLSGLQDRTHTSDLNIRTQHTRNDPRATRSGLPVDSRGKLSTGRSGNINTNNHRREVGPDQAVAVGPSEVVVLTWAGLGVGEAESLEDGEYVAAGGLGGAVLGE